MDSFNGIVQVIKETMPVVQSGIPALVGGFVTAMFLRGNTSRVEFEKIKAGKIKEAIDDLVSNHELTLTELMKCNNILNIAKKADLIYSRQFKDENASGQSNNIDFDWFLRFFESAGSISNEDMQLLWAKLLANRLKGNRNITRKFMHTMTIIEDEDIAVFSEICSMTFDSVDREASKYPFIYIGNFPSYYNELKIRRYHLRSLADLGLIEYDITNGFVLPAKIPIIKYGETKIKLSASDRVAIGDIRLTALGRTLYGMTEKVYRDDFIGQCKRMWKSLEIKYETLS